jgi:hypothetical protein
VHLRAVRGDDPEQPDPVDLAQLQMPDHHQPVERLVLREAAHPLVRDPGLVAAGGADRDRGVGRGQQVVQADPGRHREPRPRRIYSSKETPPIWAETLAHRTKEERRFRSGPRARSAAFPHRGRFRRVEHTAESAPVRLVSRLP